MFAAVFLKRGDANLMWRYGCLDGLKSQRTIQSFIRGAYVDQALVGGRAHDALSGRGSSTNNRIVARMTRSADEHFS
jgi:hypothetical protein